MPDMNEKTRPFGQLLREKRLKREFSLRQFAQLVGISPTYLSQVEQGKIEKPPTAERVKKMAELLGENPDEWIALAGRVPEDLSGIIQQQPTELPELLREASGLSTEQLQRLRQHLRRLKEEE